MNRLPTYLKAKEYRQMSKGSFGIDSSAGLTALGVVLMFSMAVGITLVAPRFVDKSWTEPASEYQVQMYEVSDPYLYISPVASGSEELQFVQHVKSGYSLLAFRESDIVRIIAPPALEKYITKSGDKNLKLTSRLLLLKEPENTEAFKGEEIADSLRAQLQQDWERQNPNWKDKKLQLPRYKILELYEHSEKEAFITTLVDEITQNWVDENFEIFEGNSEVPYHHHSGVVYTNNPQEYRIEFYRFSGREGWRYSPEGKSVASLAELKGKDLGFLSRKELIERGETLYAQEGCWYCHTDQTRTLVQDTVLNGSESFPAPPSTANEYIYQRVTFPGTRRIGPDISRVGIKRPHRDWHKSHFWSPKTASPGSIMPSFRHFFDFDPRGTSKSEVGVPNYKFEAIYQYLMTKGTRITPPNKSWWTGRDPVDTLSIIEGKKADIR